MASGTPTTKPEEAQAPPARDPWWRQWLEPAVAVAMVTALVIALVTVGVAGFQSLKSDIRDAETRLSQQMDGVKLDLKADNRILSDKLDRVLESLLASKS